MATERIQIIVSERGARTVRREIEGIGDGAKRAEGAVLLLKRTLGLIGVGALIHQLVQLSDTYTNIQNRLRLVTTDTANLSRVTAELFTIANSTRSSYEATASMYSRVALSSKDLGRSQQELLNFTESLNQAVILSGASAREAEGAMIQLSQGLASGTLQGDELRSVLEQLPFVADIISQHLGVTRGELREMGKEGQVSAQSVLDAFKAARTEIAEKFAKTVPTIGQAIQVLKNRFLELWGSFMEGSGIQSLLAQSILALATHMGTLVKIVGTLAIIYAVNWIKNAVVAGTAAVLLHIRTLIALEMALGATSRAAAIAGAALKQLRLAFAFIGGLPGLILAAIAALVMFGDQLDLGTKGQATLQDFGVAAWQRIGQAIRETGQDLREYIQDSDFEVNVPDLELSWAGAFMEVAEALDHVVTDTGQAVGAIMALWDGLGPAIGEMWIDTVNQIIRGLNKMTQSVVAFINFTMGLFTGLVGGIVGAFSAIPQALRALFQKGFNAISKTAEGWLNNLIDGLNQIPGVEIAHAAFGQMTQEAMPDIGAAAREGFQKGFGAGQLIDPHALDIVELENQYRGAGARLGQAMSDAAEFEFDKTQQLLADIFEMADARAAARATEGQLNPAGSAREVKDDDDKKTKKKKKLKDAEEEARKALARFLLELDRETQMLGMNARAAEQALMIWQLEDDMKRKLTVTERELVNARIDAFQAAGDDKYIREKVQDLSDENAMLKLVGREQRIRTELLAMERDLHRQLTPEESARIEGLLRENEVLATQSELLRDTVGARQELLEKIQAIAALRADPNSGFTGADAATQLNDLLSGAFENTPDMVNGQIEQLRWMYDQIRQMRDTDFQDARTKSQALANLEYQMTQKRLQQWSDMFGTLAQLSRSGNKKLAAIGKAAAVAQAIIDGVLAVQKALASLPPPMSFVAAAIAGVAAAANVATILSTNAGGFAEGGQFMVKGRPGIDTNNINMDVTRGERVTVETARQQRENDRPVIPAPIVNVKNVNVLDPREALAVLETSEGEQVITNIIERNASKYARLMGNV